MGILSDPQKREKLLKLIQSHERKLCILSYFGGLIWFLALASPQFSANTYFSENALLPGVVVGEFHAQTEISKLYEDLKTESNRRGSEVPSAWIESKFLSMGLDAHKQNFSIRYPFTDEVVYGTNVYAILRAPRSSSVEAIVLSAPFRPSDSVHPSNNAGIAVMMSLARYFRRHTYWSKDIIFVVTDMEDLGIQAWLHAYYKLSSPVVHSGHLDYRGGFIVAAVNLDIPRDNFDYMNVMVEGLNGKLPNLDLFNLAVRLCQKEGVYPRLHDLENHYADDGSLEGYLGNLKTYLAMVKQQATGSPSGNHGLFHSYGIEAVTLQGVAKRSQGGAVSMLAVGRIVEGMFRSLNNLLEKFHQSFFFYLLPSVNHYVSIGMYMPPLGLLVLPLLVQVITLWIATGTDEAAATKDAAAAPAAPASPPPPAAEADAADHQQKSSSRFSSFALGIVVLSFLLGYVAFAGLELGVRSGKALRLPVEEALSYGVIALFCSTIFMPTIFRRKQKAKKETGVTKADWRVLKFMNTLIFAAIIGTVSLLNFSLGLIVAVFAVPAFLILTHTENRFVRFVQQFYLLFASPVVLPLFFTLLNVAFSPDADGTVGWLFSTTWAHFTNSLYRVVVEYQVHSNWTYGVVSLLLYPCWTTCWALANFSAKPAV